MGLRDGLVAALTAALQTLIRGLLPLWERQAVAVERQAAAIEALQHDVAALLRADAGYAATLAAAEAGAADPSADAAEVEVVSAADVEAAQVELWAFKGWWWQTHGESLDDEAAMEQFRRHFQRWPGEVKAERRDGRESEASMGEAASGSGAGSGEVLQ